MIDRYSRYAVGKDLARINAETVIKVLDDICADFGYMRVLKSDNGPPFEEHSVRQVVPRLGYQPSPSDSILAPREWYG